MIPKARIAVALCLLTLPALAQPKGRRPADASLIQAIRKTLPAGATEVNKPLALVFPPLGKIYVVLYRKSSDDHQIRGLALLPNYKAVALPETPSGDEEIATSVFSAHLTPGTRALIVLFYTHASGKPGSQAHGRVYVYQSGAFRLDPTRSVKLEDVRTAAVARLKLAE